MLSNIFEGYCYDDMLLSKTDAEENILSQMLVHFRDLCYPLISSKILSKKSFILVPSGYWKYLIQDIQGKYQEFSDPHKEK